MDYEKLLSTSATVGVRLLESGAEIYRVEESVQRILTAYGVNNGAVFAIPSFMVITINNGEGQALTRSARILNHETNLQKVDLLNDLCRRICLTKPDFHDIHQQLDQIDHCPRYNTVLRIGGCALIGFAFTLFFGGTWQDSLCAVLCGGAIGLVCHIMSGFKVNLFFMDVTASAVSAAVALTTILLQWGSHADIIIIGALMSLVPGVALTNFMRDVIAGDLVAGLTKLTEALMIAGAIALGAGIVLTGFAWMGVVIG